jgi:hypothetical protein
MTKEEFFETTPLPYYSKTNVSYFKIVSEDEMIYISDKLELGIMIGAYFFLSATANDAVKISANEFEVKYMNILERLKAKI